MTSKGELMRAVIMVNIGRPRVLKTVRLARPTPGPGQALVKVHAASINPSDLLYRRGRLVLRKPMPHILGADLAGEIVELGADVAGWQPGDRVCACFEQLGSAIDGAYAEYCALPADELVKLPDDLPYQAAAAAGASFAQAYLALIAQGKLKKADTLVVRGADQSIGSAALQIGAARGAKVIAIGRAQYAAQLRELGADIVLDDAAADLVRQVKVATDEAGASLILHGQESLDLADSLAMLANGGRLVIAAPVFKPASKLNTLELYQRNLSLLGACGGLKPKDMETILAGLIKGRYQPLIHAVLPLSQARQAHRQLERQPVFGKIILVPDAVLEAARKPDNWVPIE